MNSPEDTNAGPVIRDLRRIDPVTGQVRDPGQQGRRDPGKPRQPGRHAASKPGGTGARPAQPGSGGPAGPAPGSVPGGPGMPGGPGPGAAAPENAGGQAAGVPGGTSPAGPPGGGAGAQAPSRPDGADAALAAQLAERTADVQRIQAEYANYRKRVERDRLAVREQALANVLSALLPVLDDIGRAREHGELTGGFKSVGESLETTAAKLGLESFGDAGEPFDPRVHEALTHTYSTDVTEPTAVQILQPGYRVGDRIVRPARVAVAEPSDGPAQGSPDEPRGTPAGNN
ncbi:MAG TPA: nucleotide exchange factor GrpE [Streptosporangiaceae bacterium]